MEIPLFSGLTTAQIAGLIAVGIFIGKIVEMRLRNSSLLGQVLTSRSSNNVCPGMAAYSCIDFE
jgi:hypothetical protein